MGVHGDSTSPAYPSSTRRAIPSPRSSPRPVEQALGSVAASQLPPAGKASMYPLHLLTAPDRAPRHGLAVIRASTWQIRCPRSEADGSTPHQCMGSTIGICPCSFLSQERQLRRHPCSARLRRYTKLSCRKGRRYLAEGPIGSLGEPTLGICWDRRLRKGSHEVSGVVTMYVFPSYMDGVR